MCSGHIYKRLKKSVAKKTSKYERSTTPRRIVGYGRFGRKKISTIIQYLLCLIMYYGTTLTTQQQKFRFFEKTFTSFFLLPSNYTEGNPLKNMVILCCGFCIPKCGFSARTLQKCKLLTKFMSFNTHITFLHHIMVHLDAIKRVAERLFFQS